MKSYQDMLMEYRKRQKDTLVDTITTGLSYADNVVVDYGVLEKTGLLTELTGTVCNALPFVIIAFNEGAKVILGRKSAKTGTKDAVRRCVKTGTAISVGALAGGIAGLWAAIPASMGSRFLFDRYKSRHLENLRIQSRIHRLDEMNQMIRSRGEESHPLSDEDFDAMEAAGYVH